MRKRCRLLTLPCCCHLDGALALPLCCQLDGANSRVALPRADALQAGTHSVCDWHNAHFGDVDFASGPPPAALPLPRDRGDAARSRAHALAAANCFATATQHLQHPLTGLFRGAVRAAPDVSGTLLLRDASFVIELATTLRWGCDVGAPRPGLPRSLPCAAF